MTILLPFITLLTFLPIVILLVLLISRWKKQQNVLSHISDALGASRSGRQMVASFEGTEYSYYYYPGSKNAPAYFQISVGCPSTGAFRVSREKGFDRFSKKLGIVCEIQTGDPSFDEEFYIVTDQTAFASSYFMDSEKREAVRAIFAAGFTEVKHDGKTMETKWSPFPHIEKLEPSLVTATVGQLMNLAKNMPLAYPELELSGDSNWRARRIVAFAIPVTLLVLGVASWIWGGMRYDPLDDFKVMVDSLKYSLPALLLFLFLAVRLLSGRSSSHRELIAAFFICLMAFPVAGIGFEIFLNGSLDQGEPVSHQVAVVNKYTTKSKNSTYYHVRFSSWRQQAQTEDMSISSDLYRRVTPSKSVLFAVTKPGRFGFEWMVSYRIADTGDKDAQSNPKEIEAPGP